MFISTAWAQAAGGGGAESMFGAILPFILIFVVFYFLLIRPQQKRVKEHRQAVSGVRRGDRVTTGGGIVGTVARVDDQADEVLVEIAEGVKVRVRRQTLMDVQSKSEPVAPAANDSDKKKK